MDGIYTCVFELKSFFESVMHQAWDKAKATHENIVQLEAKADDLKKDIRLHLPTRLFMPVARADILNLLKLQDKIANKAKHIANLVYSRKMVLPEPIAEHYMPFLERSIQACAQTKKAIHELDELIEAGFRGREVKIVEHMIVELDQLERDTDNFQITLRQALFKMEKELPPVDVIFLYKVIDWTGDLADRSQQVGHNVESLLAK